jgi:hypothetical protein
MNAASFRTYLQPSPALRWHPWAPLATAVLFVAFVFALGAAWGYAAAKRMAADERTYNDASLRAMEEQLQVIRPARASVDTARWFDAAVIRAAHEAQAERPLPYRARISAEDSLFGLLDDARHSRLDFDLRKAYRDSAKHSAEYRLKNLSGAAPAWQRTAALCQEVGPGWDLRAQLERTATAYSVVLGRTITAEQLAPLSGVKCD